MRIPELAMVSWLRMFIPLGPKTNLTAMNPVILGSQEIRCAKNPPRDPIRRMRPNHINGVISNGNVAR